MNGSGLYIVCAFALIAGAVDAIAGGGGLIQLPAFLLFGPDVSKVNILATNKFASFSGTLAATARMGSALRPDFRIAGFGMMAAGLGAWGGAHIAKAIPSDWFLPIVMGLSILVLLYVLLKPDLGEFDVGDVSARTMLIRTVIMGCCIGIYDGAYGPGTGSFLILGFVRWIGLPVLGASMHAKLLNLATNLGALALFLWHDMVAFEWAIPVALCNMAGGLVGGWLSLRIGKHLVRNVMIIVVALLLVRMAWDLVVAAGIW